MLKKKREFIYFQNNEKSLNVDEKINSLINNVALYKKSDKEKKETLENINILQNKLNDYFDNNIVVFLTLIMTMLLTVYFSVSTVLSMVANIDKYMFDKKTYQLIEFKTNTYDMKISSKLSDEDKTKIINQLMSDLNLDERTIGRYVKINYMLNYESAIPLKLASFLLVLIVLEMGRRYLLSFKYRKDWRETIKKEEKTVEILTAQIEDISKKYNETVSKYFENDENKVTINNFLTRLYTENTKDELDKILISEAVLSMNNTKDLYKDITWSAYNNIFDGLDVKILNEKITYNLNHNVRN